jgi:uncharacterized membrane protein
MFDLIASAHFIRSKGELAGRVPKALPHPMGIIYFTGAYEIAGAVGVLLPRFRSLAGICLIVLLVEVFPANVKAASDGLKPPRGARNHSRDSIVDADSLHRPDLVVSTALRRVARADARECAIPKASGRAEMDGPGG